MADIYKYSDFHNDPTLEPEQGAQEAHNYLA